MPISAMLTHMFHYFVFLGVYLVSVYFYSYIQNNQIVAVENGAFPADIRTM